MKGNIIPPSQAYTDSDNIATPKYYKALWHNCNKCKIHYMSEAPHVRAYLCDECWNSMPHYKTGYIKAKKKDKSWLWPYLYIVGCAILIGFIVGNIWMSSR